jgi:hypothetical protein
MSTTTAQKTGLFAANYSITSMVGVAPLVTLHLTIDTVTRRINGMASVSGPNATFKSEVSGNFFYETVMPPGQSKIMVALTGYPLFHPIGPIQPDLQIQLLLSADWKGGNAMYEVIVAGHQERFEGVVTLQPIATA